MARRTSKTSTGTGSNKANASDASPEDSVAPETPLAPPTEGEAPEMVATETDEATLGNDIVDAELVSDDVESIAAEPSDTDTGSDAADAPEGEAETADSDNAMDDASAPTPPAPPPTPEPERRSGGGVFMLLLGGVLAAGLGYGASLLGLLPGADTTTQDTSDLQTTLAQQADALAALQAQIADLPEPVEATPAPEIDLSPVTDQIALIGAQIDETAAAIGALADRVSVLEDRPVFTGDVGADAVEAAESIAAMEEQLRVQEEEAARIAQEAEATAAAAAAETEAALAEARATEQAAAEAIAQAAADAQAATAAAEAEAALNALRAALANGAAFADPLAQIAAVTDVPEALSAVAETGAPTIAALQDSFPAAARAALPVALRETAGDRPMDRIGAFLQGQLGGRAITPREGDDPDAILSRVQAAVTAGDMATALTEITALPDGAKAELAPWVADAETRVAIEAALETVAQTLNGAN